MQIAARAALGLGTLAVAGFGAKQFVDFANRRIDGDHADLQRATAEADQQWDAWKAKLDAEFPGGALPTPQDHARFKQFLQQNPAPSFVKVEHDEFTRVKLSAGTPVDPDLLPVEYQKSNGYPIGFGGMMAIGGAAMLYNGIACGGSSLLRTGGVIAGGAALAGIGAAAVISGIHGFRVGEGTDGVYALQQEINGY